MDSQMDIEVHTFVNNPKNPVLGNDKEINIFFIGVHSFFELQKISSISNFVHSQLIEP